MHCTDISVKRELRLMTTISAKKNCVILYSRRHFDPSKSTELSGSSAGRIAATIYEAAKSCPDYNVHYFDSFDFNEWIPMGVDVLVTLIDNLPLAKWFFRPKRIIVIAVNQHPLVRLQNGIIGLASGLPNQALVPSDGIYQPFHSLNKANSILCVGNEKTTESYKRYLPMTDIRQVNYESNFSLHNSNRRITNIENVLVLMSSIGYRKGFDRFVDEINQSKYLKRFKFHIVGHPEGPYWQAEVEKLISEHSNVKFHGWMLNNNEEFSNLIDKMDIAIFPTREEGLVGSLLECIDLGLISLHTSNSGLDNLLEELTLSDVGLLNLTEKLGSLSNKTSDELLNLHRMQEDSMKAQFAETSNIGKELILLLEQGVPAVKPSRVLMEVHEVLKIAKNPKNFKVLLLRCRLIQFRYLKIKIAIKSPMLFVILKRLRNLFKV